MILLTGATGRIAGRAAKMLSENGTPFRAFVRDAEKFGYADNESIDVVAGDLKNVIDVKRAVQGVTKALLVTANGEQQSMMEKQFADEAAAAGVSHIIKISSMEAGADAVATFPKMHFEIEQHIQSLPIEWTMVRPNFFMQNLLLFANGIKHAGVISLPLGQAKTGMLDATDVGEFCAKILTQSGHEKKTYLLSGDKLLTFDEVAEQMSAVLDKNIRYVDQDPDEFKKFLGQFVHSKWHLDGVCGLFEEIANHSLEKLTTTLSDTLGRAPVSLQQFTELHKNAFK